MNIISKEKLNNYINYFFVVYAAFFIIEPGLGRILFYIVAFLWIVEGNFKNKLSQILKQKVLLFYILMMLSFLISLIFSMHIDKGFWGIKYSNGYEYLLSKQKYFFIVFILYTSMQKKYFRYISLSFLFQLLFIVIYSFGIKLGIFVGDKFSKLFNFVVFLDRTHYSIMLAIGVVFATYLYLKENSKIFKIFYIAILFLFVVDLFLIGGRLGQLGFLVSSIVCIYYFSAKKGNFKYLAITSLALIFIVIFSFYMSNTFKNRLLLGVKDITKVVKYNDYRSSWGVRMGFDIVVYDYLTSNIYRFVFGPGMGDAKVELKDFILKNHNNKKVLLNFEHVHNQFFQAWLNGGIMGFIFFFMMFYFLLKLKLPLEEKFFIIGVVSVYIVDSFGNLIFHRLISTEMFAFVVGYSLSLERFFVTYQKKF